MPIHPMLVHLVAVALPAAALLTVGSRWRPGWRDVSAVVLYVGAVGAVVATVSGLVDHFPYEETALIGVIEDHQKQGLLTTAVALGLTAWRALGRRRGTDPGAGVPFQVLIVLLTGLVLLTGKHGGDLVYTHGVGVEPVGIPAAE